MEGGRVDANHVQRTDLDLLDGVFFRTQRAVAEDLDVILAVGFLADDFADLLDRHDGRVVERVYIRRTKIAGLDRGHSEGRCQNDAQQFLEMHNFLLDRN